MTTAAASPKSAAVPARRRTRDPEGSRAAVLDAGERLFAERGYDGATMQEIGEAAGLSRGAPAYIFGDKPALYRAVIQRVFEDRHRVLAPAFEAVASLLADRERAAGRSVAAASGFDAAEEALRPAISAYLEFLAERPAFVRLMQWEALHGGEGLRSTPHRSSAVGDALTAAAPSGGGKRAEAEAKQLVLSCVALCFFPFEHGETMLPSLGMDPTDPGFRRERARHVARLLAAAITGPPAGRARREEQR